MQGIYQNTYITFHRALFNSYPMFKVLHEIVESCFYTHIFIHIYLLDIKVL